jgi:hypothetical protein
MPESLIDDPYHGYTPQQKRFVDEMRKTEPGYVLPDTALNKQQNPKIARFNAYSAEDLEIRRRAEAGAAARVVLKGER